MKSLLIKAILYAMLKTGEKRVLGLDIGKRRIGLAITDECFLTAQPLKVIKRSSLRDDLAEIIEEVVKNNAGRIVVGMPYEMNGTEGPAAGYTRRFTSALEAALKAEPATGQVDIEFWDERFSTVAVERVLIEGDARRSKRKQVVDKLAAAYILQGWLDGRQNREED
ncbi:Putative pre-16S rRNA nuclease Yqg [hydrothermal vent metagenome]|uniref:Pre-16S rRNA nuclease Yqg n=1 Tax=hydrothermal vent metagenome TaxID=652676 RepID=A0A3B0QZA0_9ZZZZ